MRAALLLALVACTADALGAQTPANDGAVPSFQPLLFDASVALACRPDVGSNRDSTIAIDLFVDANAGASAGVISVGFTRTPARAQPPQLSISLRPLGATTSIGEACGGWGGAALRTTPARYAEVELWFTTWVPIHVTVRTRDGRSLVARRFERTLRAAQALRW